MLKTFYVSSTWIWCIDFDSPISKIGKIIDKLRAYPGVVYTARTAWPPTLVRSSMKMRLSPIPIGVRRWRHLFSRRRTNHNRARHLVASRWLERRQSRFHGRSIQLQTLGACALGSALSTKSWKRVIRRLFCAWKHIFNNWFNIICGKIVL